MRDRPAIVGRKAKPCEDDRYRMPLDLTLYHDRLDRTEAALLATLADPVRLRILHLLGEGHRDVHSLSISHGLQADAVEAHLQALVGTGLVVGAPVGGTGPMRYRIEDPEVARAFRAIRRSVSDRSGTGPWS